jgi:hypothetical protein
MRRNDRRGPGMITVFSRGAGWAVARGDLVGDGAGREVVGLAGLLSCAEQGEHWQKRPAARRAEKQITGFTAGRLFEKLRDLRLARFGVQLYIWNLARVRLEPRDWSQLSGWVTPDSATSLWSTAFV